MRLTLKKLTRPHVSVLAYLRMSKPELIQHLRRLVRQHGSQIAVARLLGLRPSYFSDVINKHREPGPKILRALKLKRVVKYEAA